MHSLFTIIGALLPRAYAANIEALGSQAPGIADMWSELKTVFPHTDYGSGGLAFVLLAATNIVLQFLSGAAALMIVYGGIRMITTVGDETGHTEAIKVVQYAVMGLILALCTDAIVLYTMSVVKLAAGG